MPEFIECLEPLCDSSVVALESRLEVRLPAAYRKHLMRYNGGWCDPRHFATADGAGDSLVARFLGVHEGEHANLERYARNYNGRIPADMLPIAHDPFGNLILISVSGDRVGEVYFWEYELDGVHRIAETLDAFLEGLHRPPDQAGLHDAKDPPTTRKLIRRGARIDAVDDEGHTPLDKACIARRWDVAQLLIRAGADLRRSATALYGDWVDLAVRRAMLEQGGQEMASELLMHWNTQLQETDLSLLELLLEFEPDLSSRRSTGVYRDLGVLHRVQTAGVIDLLVEAGADVNATDGDGWTALHHAAEMWHDEGEIPAVESLLDAGADLHARTPNGETALDLALEEEVAAVLRARGARTGEQLDAE